MHYSVTLPSAALAGSVQIRIWQSGKKNASGTDQFANGDFKIVVHNPEPATCALVALGSLGLAIQVRRRRRQRQRAALAA